MSEDLSQVELSCEDEKGHKHTLSVSFPPDFPSSPPTASHSLPTSVWTAPTLSSSLPLMVASWREAIASLSSAWEALHELDRLCWVVEPWPPLPYHLHRRLMVAPSVTLHLTVDPAAPLAMPDIQFLGAENRVARLRKTLMENLESWAEDEPLLTNLERLLELNLPARDEEGNEEWGVECGICYSFLLGNQLPSLICEESRCCRPFHPTCLYEYFQVQTIPIFLESYWLFFRVSQTRGSTWPPCMATAPTVANSCSVRSRKKIEMLFKELTRLRGVHKYCRMIRLLNA